MKRSGKMEKVSEAFQEAEGVLRGNDAFQFWLFQQRWPSIIGDVLAEESYIGRRDGKRLFLYVTNSVWMQEFMMQREELLRRIQEDPYGARFEELRIQMGPRQRRVRPTGHLADMARFYDTRKSLPPVTAKEEQWIENWTETHVGKEELRDLIANMMRGAIGCRKEELAEGFHPCARCGTLCAKGQRLCYRCQAEQDRQTRNRVVLLLKARPELLYEEVCRAVPCTYRQFAEARDLLIHRYRENYYNQCGTEEERRRLLSLLIHKPFEQITESEAAHILSALPVKKRYDGNRQKEGDHS